MSTAIISLFFGLAITIRLETRAENRIAPVYSDSAALLEEVFSSVQTVMSLNAETKLLRKCRAYIDVAKRLNIRKSPLSGVKFVLSYFILLSSYALAFWYGVKLVLQGKVHNSGNVVIVILCVNMSTNALRMLIPSWTMIGKATTAAHTLLLQFSHEPSIDPLSKSGKCPDHVLGRIEMQGVTFAYPAKPSVMVLDGIDIVFEKGQKTCRGGRPDFL
ncbi:hypothetical protein ACMFMG_009835 [Clarireedia jacksonii]